MHTPLNSIAPGSIGTIDMIKIHQYIDPSDDSIWCVTIEWTDADGKPHFHSETDSDRMAYLLQADSIETLKENTGSNACIITVQESPS